MTYEELTNEEKAAIASYERMLRGTVARLMAIFRDATPQVWNEYAAQSVDPVLKKLDQAATIPNTSGLVGARDLTVAELVELQQLARTLAGYAGSKLSLIVKAVGANANIDG